MEDQGKVIQFNVMPKMLCRITYLYADEPGELNVADLYERVDNADMAQFRVVGDVEK